MQIADLLAEFRKLPHLETGIKATVLTSRSNLLDDMASRFSINHYADHGALYNNIGLSKGSTHDPTHLSEMYRPDRAILFSVACLW